MARLNEYRQKIQDLLTQLAEYGSANDGVESQLIFDTERDHYQLAHVGWRNDRRIYGCVVHLDIRDDKIWVQHNGTEFDIAVKLSEMGIPKENIVNGFHSSYMRQFTEFAVS
ncbi:MULTISPECIES: XisI protein [Pseudanabaena]|uniref:XisI protein n=2 Tax=Pseudanabaena TaxID=1152 RepID=L8N424_9CYAN|nr:MULTISPECIES: XisI protein [Pseudanabaena]ELS33824.1 XisI protein [Pseudanabaena biceps PCC 7429]MDG3493984.1 XisI protein [Pseudanabaena catenata USMAC16]